MYNEKLYSVQMELMKSVNPANVVDICNNVMQSNIQNEIKVEYAKQKVETIQSLGLSLKSLNAAQQELIQLESAIYERKNKTVTKTTVKHPIKPVKNKFESQFQCDKCVEVFVNLRNLNNHIRVMHESGEQKCERCDEVFRDKSVLLSHMQRKTCYWKCKQCSYKSLRYPDVRHIKRNHEIVVTGIQPLVL